MPWSPLGSAVGFSFSIPPQTQEKVTRGRIMAEVGSDNDSHSPPPLKKRPLPPPVVVVGGRVDIPCYCLLDGIDDDAADAVQHQEEDEEEPDRRPRRRRRRLTVPITRLPATLGRRHETTDPHFYSLGSAKAVSREHARIDYRFPPDGAYLKSNVGVGFRLLQRPSSEDHQDDNDNDDESNNNSHHKDSVMDRLPAKGAYVLTCLSKNKIMVNQERIDQGSVTVLQSGAAIKIGPVCVYFLLPTPTTPPSSSSSSPTSPPLETETTPSAPTPSPLPKQPHRWSLDVSSALPVAAKSLTEKEESRGSTTTAIAAATTTTSTGTTSNVHLQLEALSWNDLADEYRQAKTDRRKQIVQSVIVARGALEAAVALQQEQQRKSHNNSDDDDNDEADTATTTEYAANDIIAWLENSTKYGPFQNEMKDRMEPKSYKASITKALLRAGFCRNNALGPRVRWHLPVSVIAAVATQTPPPRETTAAEEEEGGGTADSDSPEEEEDNENDDDNGSAAVVAEGEQEKDDAPDDDDNFYYGN
jgi:pSer/pThr/pTyr-binding forkhead associated (FHA) protein